MSPLQPRPGAPGRAPHVVVVNRWRERYAEYERYLDHGTHRVTYVSTEVGLGSVPETATEVALVDATDDLPAVRARVRELVSRHGTPAAIVALKEDDLAVGAQLRAEWDCPGQRPDELVTFQDKYVMCRRIAAAGLGVPAFAAAPDAGAVIEFAGTHGWPVIVKPRVGSSSEGVLLLGGPGDARAARFDARPMLVQEYRSEPMYHVDGWFDGRRLATCRPSRYINNCLQFRTGTFLASVEEDDPELRQAVTAAAEEFLAALTSTPTMFHLEVFLRRRPGAPPDCLFLEIGARVAGAEVPFVWRELHGYDLMEAAYRLQLGDEPPPPPAPAADDPVGGWLLVPAPAARPCRVTESTPMLGRPDGPYAEVVLQPGQVLPAADAYYEHVGGRFRFRGRTGAEVEAAIRATARDFRVAAEPLQPAPAGAGSKAVTSALR